MKVNNEDETPAAELVLAIADLAKPRKLMTIIEVVVKSCSSVNQKELMGLLRALMRFSNPAVSVSNLNLRMDTLQLIQRLNLHDTHKDTLEIAKSFVDSVLVQACCLYLLHGACMKSIAAHALR